MEFESSHETFPIRNVVMEFFILKYLNKLIIAFCHMDYFLFGILEFRFGIFNLDSSEFIDLIYTNIYQTYYFDFHEGLIWML